MQTNRNVEDELDAEGAWHHDYGALMNIVLFCLLMSFESGVAAARCSTVSVGVPWGFAQRLFSKYLSCFFLGGGPTRKPLRNHHFGGATIKQRHPQRCTTLLRIGMFV